jgi:hypothetical protein
MRTILASLALLAVVLAGCSAADDDATTAYDSGEAFESDGGTDDSGDSGDSDGTARAVTDASTVDLDAVPIAAVDRRIVYTGTSSAEVDDIGAAVRAARDAATVEGGYVFAHDLAADRGRLVLKVPVDRFDAVFDAVVGIGEVVDSQIEAEDVTERFVDLESRQATLATSIDRIRGFLAQTTNVDEISRLESELTNREAEHDVIAGQLRVLRDRTTYGTITASFHVPADAEALSGPEDEAGGPPGFRAGLSAGWDAIATVAGVVATVGGFLLPFVPLLVLAAALAWWVRRRRPVSPAA